VRFDRSFCTAPQCSPSRASLFTGRYPHNNGVMGLCHWDFAWDLNPDERHLAGILKDAGYRTSAIGIVHETASKPQRWGLDEWLPVPTEPAVEATLERLERFSKDGGPPFYIQVGFVEPHRLPNAPGDRTTDMGFLGGRIEPDDTLGVEVPGYLRDTEGTRTELAELQGAVHYVDGQIGRVLDGVKRFGLEDNTLVIFAVDHGVGMPRAKCGLNDPGIEVALIMRLASRDGWHGGRVVTEMISNIDYVPTLMDLLGLPIPERIQGRSFRPLLDGEAYEPHDAVFAEMTYHDYYDPRRCIRTETHKLIANLSMAPAFMDPSQSWRPRSDTVEPPNRALAYHPSLELYDLREDPWELDNLLDADNTAKDPAVEAVRKDLAARLYRHMVETKDPILQGAVTSPMHRKTQKLLEEAGA